MDSRPVGVFDSGVGGLTVLHECLVTMPAEDVVYLGDGARLPYGPRPLPERDYEMLEDWHRKRYLVLPGITGLWQVSGRSELDFDDLVHLDFIYLERWSLALDLTILLKTVPAVITRRGAY